MIQWPRAARGPHGSVTLRVWSVSGACAVDGCTLIVIKPSEWFLFYKEGPGSHWNPGI